MHQAVMIPKRGPEREESTAGAKGQHIVKSRVAVGEAAEEGKGRESMTDLQTRSHSTRTLADGELCAATDGICGPFSEVPHNLTAGRALCDTMVAC